MYNTVPEQVINRINYHYEALQKYKEEKDGPISTSTKMRVE